LSPRTGVDSVSDAAMVGIFSRPAPGSGQVWELRRAPAAREREAASRPVVTARQTVLSPHCNITLRPIIAPNCVRAVSQNVPSPRERNVFAA
jgi:hypothetical protein